MRKTVALILFFGVFATGWGALAATSAENSHLQAIRARGRLIMLCWPHQESTFVRRMVKELGADGLNRFTGSDVALMEAFAAHLGVSLEVKPVTDGFSGLIPALLAGEGDLIASSMTITPGRKAKVDFSTPYFAVRTVVIAQRDSGLSGVADLRGKLAATVPGSSHQEHLEALGFDDLRFNDGMDFVLESYQAVAYGEADFTLVDSGSAETVLARYPELGERLAVAFEFPDRDHYGIAVPPGSDLLPELDAFITAKREAGELTGF